MIHRDVKPQNVLVAEDGHLKVTDFGIARAGARRDMTEAGSVIGTAQYLSPEQARGDEVTAASDCYAVGIVLYEMLTGRVPFDGERAVTVAMKQINDAAGPAAHPGAARSRSSSRTSCCASLAKRPSERYRTAEEMSRALAEARAAIEHAAAPPACMPAARRGRPRRPGSADRRADARRAAAARRSRPPPPPARAGRSWPRRPRAAAWWPPSAPPCSSPAATAPPVDDPAGRRAQPAAEADQTLTDAGLDVSRARSPTTTRSTRGTAIRTDPAAGTR